MKIQVLGPGCYNCQLLADKAKKVAEELEIDFELEKVQDLDAIMAFGVMVTPALVLDGEVVLSGSVPHVSKIRELLEEAASTATPLSG